MIQTGKNIPKKEEKEMIMDLEKLIYDHNAFSEIQRVFATDRTANEYYDAARKGIMGRFPAESAYAFAIRNMAYTISNKGYHLPLSEDSIRILELEKENKELKETLNTIFEIVMVLNGGN